ncbi:MAG: GTPase Era [Rickettsiales bacterium]
MSKDNQKNSWVCVLGEANAGKSTLFNALLGKKLSITTPKPQTTRNTLKGIKTKGDTQLVFIDTPGFLNGEKNLDKMMLKAIHDSIPDSDVILFIHDATKKISGRERTFLSKKHPPNQRKVILVLNKIDKINKSGLLKKASEFSSLFEFSEIFMISALKKDGIAQLENYLFLNASSPGWYFDKDEETTAPLSFYIQEVIREKILLNTHKEIPYNVLLSTEYLEESKELAKIYVTIYVNSESQKVILLGSNGDLLKRISTQSRIDLEREVGKKIFLRTHIKVKSWDKLLTHHNFINY